MQANYHTHTPRCNHAVGSEREYIEQALAAGMQELGFSDHVPYPFPPSYHSGFRMEMSQTQDYAETLRELQREYAGRITIHIGFEAEYYPRYFDAMLANVRAWGCEYLIQGQHFIENELDGVYSGSPTADRRVLERYVGQTIEGMESGVFTYLAHPDLLHWCGEQSTYRRAMRRLCRRAQELKIPLELNLLGLAEGRHYPCRAFWQVAGETGCRAVLGCDAHAPQELSRPETEQAALQLLNSCGLHPEERLTLRRV